MFPDVFRVGVGGRQTPRQEHDPAAAPSVTLPRPRPRSSETPAFPDQGRACAAVSLQQRAKD